MQINLTGHHIEITDSLRNYVDTKFSKLERHFDHISNVHVILNVEKLAQKAEATMHLSGAEVFASSEKVTDAVRLVTMVTNPGKSAVPILSIKGMLFTSP